MTRAIRFSGFGAVAAVIALMLPGWSAATAQMCAKQLDIDNASYCPAYCSVKTDDAIFAESGDMSPGVQSVNSQWAPCGTCDGTNPACTNSMCDGVTYLTVNTSDGGCSVGCRTDAQQCGPGFPACCDPLACINGYCGCAENYGDGCGNQYCSRAGDDCYCGTVDCSGKCPNPGSPNAGQLCGDNCGAYDCGGVCSSDGEQCGGALCCLYGQDAQCGAGYFCDDSKCCSPCVPNVGEPGCGDCGDGTTQCNGSCSAVDDGCVCGAGLPCGTCGGTWECGGDCSVTSCVNPDVKQCSTNMGGSCTLNGWSGLLACDGVTCQECSPYMSQSCGGCGTTQCNGTCNDPCGCPATTGEPCGECGTIGCNGECDDLCACYPSYGTPCGNCGKMDCWDVCTDPCACVANVGKQCNNCGGTFDCNGTCSSMCGFYGNPDCPNQDVGQLCSSDTVSLGVYQCDGTCMQCVYPWPGSCGYCGQSNCDGSCDDPCNGCDPQAGQYEQDSNNGCVIDCSGNCDECANPPGQPCGGCGTYTCNSCSDPCNGCSPDYGQGCGICGNYDCSGNCQDSCAGCSPLDGRNCGVCGTSDCFGNCDDPCAGCSGFDGWACGNCGTIDCNGNCDDPCS